MAVLLTLGAGTGVVKRGELNKLEGPPEDIDREVGRWADAKCWAITRSNYDGEREIYPWRHRRRRGGPSPTLRISDSGSHCELSLMSLICRAERSQGEPLSALKQLTASLHLGVGGILNLVPHDV
jgi:hypothetical protein